MIKKKKVAVIGGGVSGLAAAKAFTEKGHNVHAFEKSHDFGGVWDLSRSYPDVQTQSPKDLYCYTDLPMPNDYPEWPKGPQVHAYLHSYADKHSLKGLFQLETEILSMKKRTDGSKGWTLEIKNKEKTWAEDFDFVAVCTGQFSEKNIIRHPGQDEFEKQGGTVLHSSEYKDPASMKDKDVVVLGFSKSATDIATNAAKNGAKNVTIVYREPVWRVPYFVGGINFKKLLYMRAQERQFNTWGLSPFSKFLRALVKPLVWANFRGLETLITFQLGLKKYDMVPDIPIEKDISCSIPIVTPGFFEGLKAGKIKPIRGTFERYDNGHVKMTTGQEVKADVAILAVGWKLGVPFIEQSYQDKLIEDDGQYRVYRLSTNPDLPDMGFVGFNSSFCTILSAEMIANWLVRFADGMLKNQPTDQEMTKSIEHMLKWRREERPAAKIYGGLCSAPFHFQHFDELLADMGATKYKRSNPIAEEFSYPNAKAYGKFLASTPQYKAQ